MRSKGRNSGKLIGTVDGGEEVEIVEDSFDKIEKTIFRKLTIVCYERVSEKSMNLLEKKIVTNKCLLRDKDNILNLLERESACKKKRNILED